MLSDADVQFVDRRYGKKFVRLLYVRREGIRHYIKEVEVNTKITLSGTNDFLRGDNSQVVATDSQKNTVYILAKQLGVSFERGIANKSERKSYRIHLTRFNKI